MVALAIITLFLTGYAFIYYSYLANHSEKDVSFFLSVLLISMIMNLATNGGGLFGFSVVYLIIDVLFLGLGFAVDLDYTLAFYKSIGPWFKNTFTDTKSIGFEILSFILFPVGIVLYAVDYEKSPVLAKKCGRCAAFGFIFLALLLWMILGLAL